MEFAVLLVLLVIGVVFVLPIVSIVQVSRARQEVRDLAKRLRELEEQRMQSPASTFFAAAAAPDPAASNAPREAPSSPPLRPEAAAAVAPAAAEIAPSPPILESVSADTAAPTPEAFESSTAASSPPSDSPDLTVPPLMPEPEIPPRVLIYPETQPPPKPASKINWEHFMGVKLFAWIGGLALFLGVAFFVKYSFEHDLIPPEVRAALSFLAGAGLIAGGILLSRKRYAVTAQTLCATGVVILYAVTFACHAVYHFDFSGPLATFGLMALITATAFLLAIRMEARVVAILGMLGGFLTPILLSTGHDNPVGLFGYIALLDLGLLGVTLHRRWHFLAPLGAACTVAMQVGWAARFFAPEKQTIAEVVILGFAGLFIAAFALARRWQQGTAPLLATAAIIPFVAFAFSVHFLGYSQITDQPVSLFTFILIADALVLIVAWLDPRATKLQGLAGLVCFALLATWTQSHLQSHSLMPALAAFLVFAALHTVAPPLLARRHTRATSMAGWQHFWPALTLLLVLVGIVRLPVVPFGVWPAVLLLDIIAFAFAIAGASLVGVAATLVLTLVAAGAWLLKMPASLSNLSSLLIVIGGFAVVFFIASAWLLRRLSKMDGPPNGGNWPLFSNPARGELPLLAALLPFILLIMVVARLPLLNPSPVFGLALLLVVLALGLTRALALAWMPLVILGGVLALLHAWHFEHFMVNRATLALAWYLGFYAIFTLYPFAFRKRLADLRGSWIASALSGPLVFFIVHDAVKRTWPNDVMGLLPAAFALPAFLFLAAVLRSFPVDHPRRLAYVSWYGGVALFFITLIFPIQFSRQWITLGWALEGVALLWFFHRVPHPGLRATGVGLLVAAFARLALNPATLAYQLRGDTPIFNWILYSYGAAAACQFAGARLLAPPRDRVLGIPAPAVLYSLCGILLFLLLNLEIADYFTAPGSRVRFQFQGNFARDMTYTIAWALFAFTLLVIGLWKAAKATRYAALALLTIALAKLFFHDLASLGQLYRVAALVGVAIIAILASFIYQRFLPTNRSIDDAKPRP